MPVVYVFTTPVCGSVPLYRVYNPDAIEHFYTTNVTKRDNALQHGYKDDGVSAYVNPVKGDYCY